MRGARLALRRHREVLGVLGLTTRRVSIVNDLQLSDRSQQFEARRKITMESSQHQPPPKRQKREDYRKAPVNEPTELPKKKFYRQRAHANPFSDHNLT